jgi:hypothetical protein
METSAPLKPWSRRLPWWGRVRQAIHHAYRREGKGDPARAAGYVLSRLHKATRHLLFSRRNQPKDVLFIFGCQRSGTSLIVRIFDRDLEATVFPEGSPQVYEERDGQKPRLQPLAAVQAVVRRERAPFVVIKPLMEAQNAPEVLAFFPGSKGLWVYRHYTDVANSNLKLFGQDNGIQNLRALVEDRPGHWLAEHASAEVRAIVGRHYSPVMSPSDAAALFWFVRNRLFFDLELDRHPQVQLCRYEDLVTEPLDALARVYGFLGRPFPGKRLIAEVHRESLGKGRHLALSPAVDELCRTMLDRLDRACAAQRAAA